MEKIKNLKTQRPIISISGLSKKYSSGLEALTNINLEVQKGEIFALLGPNGAGKTTLINIICGIVNPSQGSIKVDGYDIISDYRKARALIGLVPQELTTHTFETVWQTVSFTRGLFGKQKKPEYIEKLLKDFFLWEKKNSKIVSLSGGMKKRVMILKALSHEPCILFLDEPTAGVDVELRQSLWRQVQTLRKSGVTIILTTHYIEEAEEMADRIGVINRGKLILTQEKTKMMKTLGKKSLEIKLKNPLSSLPYALRDFADLKLNHEKQSLVLTYSTQAEKSEISSLLECLKKEDIEYSDLTTRQSSLEEIFVQILRAN